MRSMTAFGRAEAVFDGGSVTAKGGEVLVGACDGSGRIELCGGGEMSADKIVDVPLEALRSSTLFLNVRSGMTVTVRAWNHEFDRDGQIFRGEDGRLAIHWTKPE